MYHVDNKRMLTAKQRDINDSCFFFRHSSPPPLSPSPNHLKYTRASQVLLLNGGINHTLYAIIIESVVPLNGDVKMFFFFISYSFFFFIRIAHIIDKCSCAKGIIILSIFYYYIQVYIYVPIYVRMCVCVLCTQVGVMNGRLRSFVNGDCYCYLNGESREDRWHPNSNVLFSRSVIYQGFSFLFLRICCFFYAHTRL